jgi:hypothetical protein
MEGFDALNLVAIPRDQNFKEDELVVVASTLQLSQDLIKGNITVEVVFRPSVPDNVDHWQIFDDDKQVIKFLNHMQEFSEFHINEEEEGCNYIENGHKVNPVPRGLVSQEQLFDRKYGHKHEETRIKPGNHFEFNIGTNEEPRMVKVGKSTPEEEKKEIINY